jgi:hypothetical protein
MVFVDILVCNYLLHRNRPKNKGLYDLNVMVFLLVFGFVSLAQRDEGPHWPTPEDFNLTASKNVKCQIHQDVVCR